MNWDLKVAEINLILIPLQKSGKFFVNQTKHVLWFWKKSHLWLMLTRKVMLNGSEKKWCGLRNNERRFGFFWREKVQFKWSKWNGMLLTWILEKGARSLFSYLFGRRSVTVWKACLTHVWKWLTNTCYFFQDPH